MRNALVIGATGVAGSAGIRALREHFPGDVRIVGVWLPRNGADDAPDVDVAVHGDVGDPAFIDRVREAAGDEFDWCLFAMALGDVGFPVREANAEQIAASNRLSFDPLPRLENALRIGTIVAYSTFYNLEHQRITYGAMGHSKHAIEQWVVHPGKSERRCIRAGAFRSASSQGIKLLVRRRAKELAESTDPLLRSFFAGEKPSVAVERLEQAVFEEERRIYGDTGTDIDGLVEAHRTLFAGTVAPFVNVCGQRIWPSTEVLPIL